MQKLAKVSITELGLFDFA